MRTIILSTDVFAALWSQRQPGEDSENAILERLLGLPRGPSLPLQNLAVTGGPRGGGIYNRMFDVHFPQGFEIFRSYKSKTYSAVVRDGRWVMENITYPSLFALSMAIADSQENPWVHWKYRDAEGRTALIKNLRKVTPDAPPPERKLGKARKKAK